MESQVPNSRTNRELERLMAGLPSCENCGPLAKLVEEFKCRGVIAEATLEKTGAILNQKIEALEKERDDWKRVAEEASLKCIDAEHRARERDEWKRRAEELERIARIQQEEMDKIEHERDDARVERQNWKTAFSSAEKELDALAVMVGEMRGALDQHAGCFLLGENHKVPCDHCNGISWALALTAHQAAKIAEARKKLEDLVRSYNCCIGEDAKRTEEAENVLADLDQLTRKS